MILVIMNPNRKKKLFWPGAGLSGDARGGGGGLGRRISECFDKLTKTPTISYQTCKWHVHEAKKCQHYRYLQVILRNVHRYSWRRLTCLFDP